MVADYFVAASARNSECLVYSAERYPTMPAPCTAGYPAVAGSYCQKSEKQSLTRQERYFADLLAVTAELVGLAGIAAAWAAIQAVQTSMGQRHLSASILHSFEHCTSHRR
jgi:hypothetical protein